MIKVENVSHAYDGSPVLVDVSFEIGPGEKVVLLGSNGTGKTSLLKILNGLIFPREGRYVYKGRHVTKGLLKDRSTNREFRQEVVLLFQNPEAMIFNPTVFDEIAFGPRQLGMKEADIDRNVRRWGEKLGVSRHLGRPPFLLSSGEKQRVCLASLLILEPVVLLLDEPTANLDPRSTGWLVDFLQELDATVLTATHNLSLAPELGERTILLSEDHRLIYDGGIASLLEDLDRLEEANLLHTHLHRHDKLEHGHFHAHDWE